MKKLFSFFNSHRNSFLAVIAAGLLAVVLHFVLVGSTNLLSESGVSYEEPKRFNTALKSVKARPLKQLDSPVFGESEFETIVKAYSVPDFDEVQGGEFEASVPEPAEPVQEKTVKLPKAPSYEPYIAKGSPQIAIIIDDMGVDRSRSFKVVDIDAPLTLAFLPYAESLQDITRKASDNGHELMIHMPMQATTNPVSLGPIAIKIGMTESEVKSNMRAAFESFDGYIGLNNHMGSRVTQDRELMSWVMESLKDRDLYFIDSKTIGSSVAADVAQSYGLSFAVRDVFLDHENTDAFARSALRKLEAIAMKNGRAIAIGHPKDVTINALKAWLPDVQARGFEIVHASALLRRPSGSKPITVASRKAEHPKAETIVALTEPASGPKVRDTGEVDPNSAQAREAILKRMLGQVE